MENTLYNDSRPVHPIGCTVACFLFLIPVITIILFYIISLAIDYISKNFHYLISLYLIFKVIDFKYTYKMISKNKKF